MANDSTDSLDPLEEYDELVMSGRAPDARAFAARFPEHPDLLARIHRLEQLRADLDGAARTLSPTEPAPRRVAGFELLEPIGQGGMGRVFLARRLTDGTTCALKLGRHASESAMRRYRREAQVAASLNHPGIAQVIDFGVEDERAYLATELVPGKSLRELLDGGALPPPASPREVMRRVLLVQHVAAALAHAHARRVVHRDVKPSNIMVQPDGSPRLIDFGVALPLERADHSRITRTGVFLGSHNYAAPEQLRGEKRRVGSWSDTYGLGATLYELLAGKPPFQYPTFPARVARAGDRPASRPAEINRAISRELDNLVMRALAPARRKRFRDGEQMRRALAALTRRE